jgi:hypothetical protein
MKLVQARIVTNDVPRLTQFYREVIGATPQGDDRYVEFHTPALTLAISSQAMIDRHSAGAAMAAANRSVILDFEVEDADEERKRLQNIVSEFVWSQRPSHGATGRCCSAIQMAI